MNNLQKHNIHTKLYESRLIYLSVESGEHTQNIVISECPPPHFREKSRPKVLEAI